MDKDRNRFCADSRCRRVLTLVMVSLCAISLRTESLLASFQLFNVEEVVVVVLVAVKLNKSSTF